MSKVNRELGKYLESRVSIAQVWLSLSNVPAALIEGFGSVHPDELKSLTPVDAHVLSEFIIYSLAATVVRTAAPEEDPVQMIFVELQGLVEGLSKVTHTIPFMTWLQHARVNVADALVKFLTYYRSSNE